MRPSQVFNEYWLYSKRELGSYPQHTSKSGKWLIFVPIDKIDYIWEVIKKATVNGMLGNLSKVATARKNPTAKDHNIKVICVYTYDYSDMKDVFRIRRALTELGFTNKLIYKSDQSTREGRYGKNVGIYKL